MALELISIVALTVFGCLVVSIPARRHETWHRRFVGIPYDPYRKVRR